MDSKPDTRTVLVDGTCTGLVVDTSKLKQALIAAELAVVSFSQAQLAVKGEKKAPRVPVVAVPAFRAGRNDPCPCGSGKKFKKCCVKKTRWVRTR